MWEIFYPDEEAVSVYSINFENLYAEGIRAALFDIDNTLVMHGAAADEKIKQFFNRLHNMGIQTFLLSNNKRLRVESFAQDVKSDFIFQAKKPGVFAYEEAVRRLGMKKQEAVFIGDQLFTDILGAKRAGIRNILVRPINKREEIQIILKRYLEIPVLWEFRRKRK